LNALAAVVSAAYRLYQPILFRKSAQAAHEQLLSRLAVLDSSSAAIGMLQALHRMSTRHAPMHIGGAVLNFPLMMAAGFVKGHGFATEAQALLALQRGDNLIPGWRAVPALVGQVEFGSFTRYPRIGNSGVVLWRDVHTQSLQNRVGLRNPGARAAAYFLRERRSSLPPIYGINLAVSPGVADVEQQQAELVEAAHLFLEAQLHPAWLTLNLSCPNTEDDPAGRQTESLTRLLCEALIKVIQHYRRPIPLWVKVSPGLSTAQYRALMSAAAEAGVQGIIATNTLSAPAPDQSGSAGLSGRQLFPHSLAAAAALQKLRYELNAPLDVIACGGILDGAALAAFHAIGIYAAQVWSTFVFRGPLALQMIESETYAR
jgi:dihydroorotate dehydrogenase